MTPTGISKSPNPTSPSTSNSKYVSSWGQSQKSKSKTEKSQLVITALTLLVLSHVVGIVALCFGLIVLAIFAGVIGISASTTAILSLRED